MNTRELVVFSAVRVWPVQPPVSRSSRTVALVRRQALRKESGRVHGLLTTKSAGCKLFFDTTLPRMDVNGC